MIPLVAGLGRPTLDQLSPHPKKTLRKKVFLSYVRQDKQQVSVLYQRLLEAGYSPWMDQNDLVAGECWRTRIEREIKDADFFVVCLSHNSLKRGFLQREIRNALDIWQEKLPSDIYLIPLRLEDCQVHDNLSEFQWVNFFEPDGWDRLLQSLTVGMERRGCVEAHVQQSSSDIFDIQQTPPSTDPSALEAIASKLPLVTFPRELGALLRWLCPRTFQNMGDDLKRFLITIGTKLEPIVQIIPATPVSVVIGFECLALGALGENFSQICKRASGIDPSDLRLLMALASMKTAETLRVWATENGKLGARHLHFSINLDPEMIISPRIGEFLGRYRHLWERYVLFEVSEKTTSACLRQLRELQVDYKLRYCADDYNAWCHEAKLGLQKHVELSKVDYATFRNAMELKVIDPEVAVAQLKSHKIDNKPLIVEGVEKESDFTFLEANWPSLTHGNLFGQGYFLKPGQPWEIWTMDLQEFNLPGGHILSRKE
jgi:EAL domain-containing protein (putative c-di-GMP-specific phosphodiesterase class I)